MIETLENRRMMSLSTIVVDPVPGSIISEPINAYVDVAKKMWVAYLPDLQVTHVSQLHGQLNWGDGTSSPAEFDRDKNGGIDVVGKHTYKAAGTYNISSSNLTEYPYVQPGHPSPQFILLLPPVSSTATVTAEPPANTETVGTTFSATLGKFNQFTLDIIFTAKINWGDSHVNTPGTLTGGDLAQGNWTVTGTHKYAHNGTYKVTVDVFSQIAPGHGPKFLAEEFVVLIDVVE